MSNRLLRPGVDRAVVERLRRFADGETARTIYKLPPNGRFDPMRADLRAILAALPESGYGPVATAWHDGFMAALGCAPWPDASDFAALVGMEYAAGRPYPPTMPKRVVPDQGYPVEEPST